MQIEEHAGSKIDPCDDRPSRITKPLARSERCGVSSVARARFSAWFVHKPRSSQNAAVIGRGNHGKGKASQPAEIDEIFRRFQTAEPEPKGELESVNPFTLLVAVVLSAQATDAGVNKATPAFSQIADTPRENAGARRGQGLRDLIKTIGLYRTKAKNVIALSKALVEQHGGEVPREREALEALPGVGRKTANVVLNIAFGEPTIAVDTHIFRVGNRTGLAPGKTPLEVETKLDEGGARAIQAPRPSLADPAWPLCLQGAQARMLALPTSTTSATSRRRPPAPA